MVINMKENKTETFILRLSSSEKEKLVSLAKEHEKTLSSFIREKVLDDKIVTKTDIHTLIELKRIGNNLNQIAKHLNTIPHEDNVRNMLDEIDIYLNQLLKISSKLV